MKTAYDKLNSFLYDKITNIPDNTIFDTYAVYLTYSHDGKHYDNSVEVFEVSPCEQSVCWFNDWYEGHPYIHIIGIMNIHDNFLDGNYHVICEVFNDEDTM